MRRKHFRLNVSISEFLSQTCQLCQHEAVVIKLRNKSSTLGHTATKLPKLYNAHNL
jgi:hypothetical protein